MTAAIFIPTGAPTITLSALQHAKHFSFSPITTTFIHQTTKQLPLLLCTHRTGKVLASLPSSSAPKNRLYVSRLSFRTTKESLTNAFQNFGKLVEVNLVMNKIANRSRGFALLRYATEEESQNAIEGMHGKILFGTGILLTRKPLSVLGWQGHIRGSCKTKIRASTK